MTQVTIDGWLSGNPERIYRMLSGDEMKSARTNSMREMRSAFGLPSGNEHIPNWLRYWDSITQDQRLQLRRMDLSTINESGLPKPPSTQGEPS